MQSELTDVDTASRTDVLLRSVEAASGRPIEPGHTAATEANVDDACEAADAAFDRFLRPVCYRSVSG